MASTKTTRRYWLLKSEPEVFSFDDLCAAKKKTTPWDGVRNYRARNFLRDELQVGDGVLYYHSNAEPPGVAGVARVVRAGYPDPTQFDPADSHHDPASSSEEPSWFVVDVQAVRALPRFLSLADLKGHKRLAAMNLLQKGNRLSVQPVRPSEWRLVLELGGIADPEELL